MRTHFSQGYVDDVYGPVSTGSGWGTHGAAISVPRVHNNRNHKRPNWVDASVSHTDLQSPWSDERLFAAASQPETLSHALLEYKMTHWSTAGVLLSSPRNLLELVAPAAHSLLEIFPPALNTYTLMVGGLLGSAPRRRFGLRAMPSRHAALAMYYASKAAQCKYCTLHSCHLALRRGANEGIFSGKRRLSSREAAVAAVAANIAAFPSTITYTDRQRLQAVLGRSHVDQVVFAVALMGMLNLTMTAFAVDLEKATVDTTGALASAAGWTSGHHRVVDRTLIARRAGAVKSHTSPTPLVHRRTRPDRADSARPHHPYAHPHAHAQLHDRLVSPHRARSLRAFAPKAPADDSRIRNVPKTWPAVGDYLVANIGHSFPILSRLRNRKAVRALATSLLLSLDEHEGSVDVEVKYLAALVFATLNGNHLLGAEFRALASSALGPDALEAVVQFAGSSSVRLSGTMLTEPQRRALLVAKACAMSPPVITQRMVKEMRDYMAPPMIVELVSWLGLVATLHRLYVFYFPNCMDRNFLHESAMSAHIIDDDDLMSEISFV